jgi:glycerol-3-phosphate dehydrogenase (NAD(P)+)
MSDYRCALSVLGAGSYGTALAQSTASKGLPVMLWARNEEKAQQMQQTRCNSKYLPNVKLADTLTVSSDLKEVITASKNILVVLPSHTFGKVLRDIKPYFSSEHRLAWATKGLELETGKLLSEVADEVLGDKVPKAFISGPTFAKELARGSPTAIAVAATDGNFLKEFSELLHTRTFKIYESNDIIGMQLGGAIKNVIAIGAGLSDGLGFGANARVALITRGLAEMTRLGEAYGASYTCFMGLAGLGDLLLTCTDNQSRNRTFGYYIGQGMSVDAALSKIGQVVEGYTMTKVLDTLAKRVDVQMPICNEIYEVLYEGKPGRDAALTLLGRSLKPEYDADQTLE